MIFRPIIAGIMYLSLFGYIKPLRAESPLPTPHTTESQLATLYVSHYAEIAILEMHRIGMPASVILAQGMLESAYGQSKLATKANNHFGIKCHKGWNGETYYIESREYYDNEATQERSCFRSYLSAKESYRDHSEFLRSREFYTFLFESKNFDYKFWADGLQKSGYATDPNYGKKLISIIEQYQLNKYDHSFLQTKSQTSKLTNAEPELFIKFQEQLKFLEETLRQAQLHQAETSEHFSHFKQDQNALKENQSELKRDFNSKIDVLTQTINKQLELINLLKTEIQILKKGEAEIKNTDLMQNYFHANGDKKKQADIFPKMHQNAAGYFFINAKKAIQISNNETLSEIAVKFNLDLKLLLSYNDLEDSQAILPEGCYLFLEEKAQQNDLINPYIVLENESIWMISQKFGIKLSKLLQKNLLKKGEEPASGEFIFLQENATQKPKLKN